MLLPGRRERTPGLDRGRWLDSRILADRRSFHSLSWSLRMGVVVRCPFVAQACSACHVFVLFLTILSILSASLPLHGRAFRLPPGGGEGHPRQAEGSALVLPGVLGHARGEGPGVQRNERRGGAAASGAVVTFLPAGGWGRGGVERTAKECGCRRNVSTSSVFLPSTLLD